MEELWGGGVVWWRSCVVEELRSYGVKELSQMQWWRYPFFHLFVIGSYGVEELWGGGVKELWS